MKPIITVRDGLVEVADRPRTRSKARERVEQRLGEMEPRGRRRHRTLGAGEYRLVIGAVPRVAAVRSLYIGRERH